MQHPLLLDLKDALAHYRSRWFSFNVLMGLRVPDLLGLTDQMCIMRMDTVHSELNQDGLVARSARALKAMG